MPAQAIVSTDGGGDGSDLRAPEEIHRAVLAEAIYLGMVESTYQGKTTTKPKALIIFELPESLIPDTVPDKLVHLRGQPHQVYWWVNNFKFSNSDDPQFQTGYDKGIEAWFGRKVPPKVQSRFLMGREWGDGPDQLVKGLEGDALKKQRREKPGVPVGHPLLLRVVHVKKESGKTYAEPAPMEPPPRPVTTNKAELDEWRKIEANWVPGLSPDPEAKEKPLSLSDGYVKYEEREKTGSGSGNGSEKAESQSTGRNEPEDEECPF